MSPNRPTRYYAFGFVESNVIIGGVDWTVFSRYRTGVVSYIPYFLPGIDCKTIGGMILSQQTLFKPSLKPH